MKYLPYKPASHIWVNMKEV